LTFGKRRRGQKGDLGGSNLFTYAFEKIAMMSDNDLMKELCNNESRIHEALEITQYPYSEISHKGIIQL
jgi:hypothetical protein